MKKLILALILILILVFSGCTGRKAQEKAAHDNSIAGMENQAQSDSTNSVPENSNDYPPNDSINSSSSFVFGIEYGVPSLAKTYAESGAHAVKFTPGLVIWKKIQPTENSAYDWSNVDLHVKEYQDAGFNEMQLLITAESNWASVDAAGLKVTDTRPKKEFEKDYQKFVKAAVERYDLDGKDDMPGLKYAIRNWGIEREFTGFFPGSGKEYVEVLKLAYSAVKEASPEAKVILNALLMWDIFYGNPTEKEINERFNNPLNGKRKDLTDIPVLLDAFDYFDVIDFHSLSDYSEIPPTVEWIRKEMRERGAEKEIFIGDAFPMSPLLAYGFETCEKTLISAKAVFPVTDETRCKAAELIAALRNAKSPNYEKAHAWLEKNIAIGLVKKFAVSAGEKISGINIGNLEDWTNLFVGAGTSQFMGLIDTRTGAGDMFTAKRIPLEKRPGFYALRTAVEKLDEFDEAEKKDFGENIWAYEFTKNGKKIIVAWLDEGKFYALDEITPTKKIEIPWEKDSAIISRIPLERGKPENETGSINSSNGKIEIELGFEPVFIEERQ